MKTPSEVVVWYVLPVIRRELAKELVEAYGMRQSDVGRLFGVTDAAISQYLKNKRGGGDLLEQSPHYSGFREEIRKSAAAIRDGADVVTELCRICDYVRRTGLLTDVYSEVTGCTPAYSESVVLGFAE